MSDPLPGRSPRAAFTALVAFVVTAAAYLAFGDVGLGLQDESFLWYGVQRTVQGEVPIRDFQSYDPGRYYWCALWSPLFGDGILGVRKALAVFAGLGLWCGLLCVGRLLHSRSALVTWALVLQLWIFPPHKQFEHAAAMMLVWAATRLLERPGPRISFACGTLVGLLGWFGRNHGLYGSCAFVVVFLVLWWKEPAARRAATTLAFPLGLLTGLIPLMAMMVFVPGFGAALVDSILFNLRWGTNLPRAVPWPWMVAWDGRPGWRIAADLALGCAFLVLPAVYALGLVATVTTRPGQLASRAVAIAATLTGTFYAYHAAVRSDAPHLAQCIHPLLIAILALAVLARPQRAIVSVTLVVVAAASLLVACGFNLRFAVMRPLGHRPRLETVEVAGDRLRLSPRQVDEVRGVEALWHDHVPPGELLFAAPNLPGVYAIGRRRSPTQGLFFQSASPPEVEEEMLASFERSDLRWALLSNFAISGRDELRFERTHPELWRYLTERFAPVSEPRLPRGWALLRRR